MKNKELKPKLRFNHFSEKWQQVYLGDYAKYRRGSFPQPYGKSEWYDGVGAMPFVQVVDVGEDMKLVEDTKQKISVIAQPMSVMASKGQVIVTLQGSIGRVAILQYDAYIDRTILLFEEYNDKVDAEFWGYLIKNKFDEEAKKAPGGIIKTITKDTLSDFDLLVTDFFEQQLIGDFFENIDNLIKQSKEKAEKWKNIRTSFLSKVFPKPGCRVPELRFKGFSEEWEITKIEDIATFLHGNGISWDDVNINGKYECILYGNLYTDYGMIIEDKINYRTNRELTKPVYSQKGDVLIPSSDTTPTGLARATSIEKEGVILGGGINIIRPNDGINGSYLSLLMNCYKKELIKLIKGTTVRHIYNDDIKLIQLPITKNLKEQIAIVKLFKIIDKNINLQQQKLEKLKQIKQSFLSKMFV